MTCVTRGAKTASNPRQRGIGAAAGLGDLALDLSGEPVRPWCVPDLDVMARDGIGGPQEETCGAEDEPVSYDSSTEGTLENVDGQYRVIRVTVQPSIVLKSEADLAVATRS